MERRNFLRTIGAGALGLALAFGGGCGKKKVSNVVRNPYYFWGESSGASYTPAVGERDSQFHFTLTGGHQNRTRMLVNVIDSPRATKERAKAVLDANLTVEIMVDDSETGRSSYDLPADRIRSTPHRAFGLSRRDLVRFGWFDKEYQKGLQEGRYKKLREKKLKERENSGNRAWKR